MFSPQAGVRDYETFNDQLDSLSRWIVDAEEVLKGQDPNGSSDQSLILDRMEELKVDKTEWKMMLGCLEYQKIRSVLLFSKTN